MQQIELVCLGFGKSSNILLTRFTSWIYFKDACGSLIFT